MLRENSFVQSDVKLEQQIERFWRLDTVADAVDVETQMSANDRKALSIWRDSIRHCDNGQYEVAIPFKQYPPDLVDNIEVAKQRLRALKARLTRVLIFVLCIMSPCRICSRMIMLRKSHKKKLAQRQSGVCRIMLL